MARKPDGKRWGWIAITLLAIYVSSIGPAERLSIDSLHQPLYQIARYKIPGTLLASYVNLWLPPKNRAIYDQRLGILIIEGNSLE